MNEKENDERSRVDSRSLVFMKKKSNVVHGALLRLTFLTLALHEVKTASFVSPRRSDWHFKVASRRVCARGSLCGLWALGSLSLGLVVRVSGGWRCVIGIVKADARNNAELPGKGFLAKKLDVESKLPKVEDLFLRCAEHGRPRGGPAAPHCLWCLRAGRLGVLPQAPLAHVQELALLVRALVLSSSIHKSPFALDITFFSSEYWGRSESHIR